MCRLIARTLCYICAFLFYCTMYYVLYFVLYCGVRVEFHLKRKLGKQRAMRVVEKYNLINVIPMQ